MKTLAILPRGGLGDVLYHALFAKYVEKNLPKFDPVLLAPSYGEFLTSLLGVRHVPVCSLLTDASGGVHLGNEAKFLKAFVDVSGGCLASFTNDVVDHGLARLFRLELFDGGSLGNSVFAASQASGFVSRCALNRLLRYGRSGRVNPRHIVDRQQQALLHNGCDANLVFAYREIWIDAVSSVVQPGRDSNLVLIFPETARLERNLSFEQVEFVVEKLSSEYKLCVFSSRPERYHSLDVETAGFKDRLEPLRRVRRARAVITADTFSAHLAGVCGTPTYTIYNFSAQPRWYERWGAPFYNVLHFEAGTAYALSSAFSANVVSHNSDFFRVALEASQLSSAPEQYGSSERADKVGRAA
jgi:hypothetical protein